MQFEKCFTPALACFLLFSAFLDEVEQYVGQGTCAEGCKGASVPKHVRLPLFA